MVGCWLQGSVEASQSIPCGLDIKHVVREQFDHEQRRGGIENGGRCDEGLPFPGMTDETPLLLPTTVEAPPIASLVPPAREGRKGAKGLLGL